VTVEVKILDYKLSPQIFFHSPLAVVAELFDYATVTVELLFAIMF
jgi:hypothetical protein